jgi:phosphoribosylanthranilate isomerase
MMVKICGITRAEDAALAVALGATALGFVFWPGSPRAMAPEAVREIGRGVPDGVERIGVFVDADPATVRDAGGRAGLTGVQLQGDETPAAAQALAGAFQVIKAVGLTSITTSSALGAWDGVRLLLDAYDPVRRGGTGRTIDWDRAAAIAAGRPVILAGGLTPANVREAVMRVRPAGVDVSSSLESAPGVKDPDKLRAFFAALAEVEG